MSAVALEKFITHINQIANPVLDRLDGKIELVSALTNNPRGLAAPLIARCLGNSSGNNIKHLTVPGQVKDKPRGIEDVLLWWGLIDETFRMAGLSSIDMSAHGSLFDSNIGKTYATIEVWTETELAGLHALSHYANISDCTIPADTINKRIQKVIQWHIENTQPDNATCHPWAVHLFLLHGTPEAYHYAETMLSNCLVLHAKPDELSAWILKDSAMTLNSYICK